MRGETLRKADINITLSSPEWEMQTKQSKFPPITLIGKWKTINGAGENEGRASIDARHLLRRNTFEWHRKEKEANLPSRPMQLTNRAEQNIQRTI